jgi:PleD family two-component response regulator
VHPEAEGAHSLHLLGRRQRLRGDPAREESMRRRDVLIGDDDPAVRHALHTLLADEGYSVHEAADGQ